jgi:competence ComEA-like helix-hairpin-helix protein
VLTRDERRALLFLLSLTAVGGVVRVLRPAGTAPGARYLPPAEIQAGDPVRQAALSRRAERLAQPLAPGERVDVDRADAVELERLPRVGPALARRIAEDREAHGPFGSLEGLGRVSGMGPAMQRELGRWVTFSGVARPVAAAASPTMAQPAPRPVPECPTGPVHLNTATAAELACLPGIGPALAARIVADRTARGPFGEVQALERVPGIGPALVRRVAPRAAAP